MTKEQVDVELAAAHGETVLAADEGESHAEFQ